MTKVNCTVDTCIYWGEGQICKAGEIWVKNNTDQIEGAMSTLTEISGELGTMDRRGRRTSKANTSRETCCETMRIRGDETGECPECE